MTSITRESTGAAIRALRITSRNNERAINAINRAEMRLYSTLWQWDTAHKALTVESASQPGLRHYHVEQGECQCPAAAAGKDCWHAAAWRILVTAETMRPTIKQYTDADLQRINQDVEELF